MSAVNDIQIGGEHYKGSEESLARAISLGFAAFPNHWDYATQMGCDYLQGAASKYLDRYSKKGRALEDLEKSRHYLVKLLDVLDGTEKLDDIDAEQQDMNAKCCGMERGLSYIEFVYIHEYDGPQAVIGWFVYNFRNEPDPLHALRTAVNLLDQLISVVKASPEGAAEASPAATGRQATRPPRAQSVGVRRQTR